MAADLNTVIKQLTESGIIAQGKLENFVPPKADPKTLEELVQALVKSENLTAFQGQQVKAGKAKALILGAYTILDKIGAGGMGQVFKAQHRKLKRLVAIKMLPPAMTKDVVALARFQREVEAAAKLRHPNIVGADDAAEANGVHFLVMEYVDGKDLSATVKKHGPLPVNKAVDYILQAARGLEYAHSEGIVHRDIKPANLLLDKKGVVKILDMGLARIEQADGGAQAELTGTGTVMGTVDYMSPEQAISTKNADARSDIYSLGISLHYLLAGKAAYAGDTAMEKLMAHQTQPVPSLQDVQATVSKQLDTIFKKMVAKKADQRYQTMSEVVEALERLGYGGSGILKKGDVASTIDLSSADKKLLAARTKKKALSSITDVVASEKSKNLILKIVGGSFGTIIAPILVFYLIRHLEQKEQPPAAMVAATADGPLVAGTLRVPPAGTTSDVARSSANGTRSVPVTMKAPFDAAQAKAGQLAWAKHLGTQVETTNSVGMRMTLIPPGEFLMGSTPEQVAWGRKSGEEDKIRPTDGYWGRLPEEMPQHKVTISQPFLMGSTEVTVGQFRKFIEASKYTTEAEKYGFGNSGEKSIEKVEDAEKAKDWKKPGYPTTDDTAATQLTWNDACAYCAWLSEQEQRHQFYRPTAKGGWLIAAQADGYRLPTEAEWEYACRAGTTTQYSFGDDKAQLERYGWFGKNAGGKAQPVGLKLPNPFGLFDLHGNAVEWCQDRYDGKWYEKSSPTDPNGPPSGSVHILRGGFWTFLPSYCRSAFRNYGTPSLYKTSVSGFRIVRPLDASHPETAVATTTKPSASPTKPTKPWETPEFQQWVADTQNLPAEKQIEAVSKKLVELNPGFDGKLVGILGSKTPGVENGVVTGVGFRSDSVTDISPIRALTGLMKFTCSAGGRGNGMLSDLSPLQGMRLTNLWCAHTQVKDFSPLVDCKGLAYLFVRHTPVTPAAVAALQKALPNCKIEWDDPSKAATGAMKLAYLDAAFQQWVADTQKLPAEQQIEAVRKKLMELNPGFDGKLTDYDQKGPPKIANGVVIDLNLSSGNLTDLSPVRALAGLKMLQCGLLSPGKSLLFDLSPLEGLRLTRLSCSYTNVSDLSPLKDIPLTFLNFGNTRVSDLSPLRGKALTHLLFQRTAVSDLSPLEGMPLTQLMFFDTQVADLSPLEGMNLTEVRLTPKSISKGLEVIRRMQSITVISVDGGKGFAPAEFWKRYDAGEFGKPAAKKLAYLDPAFQQWVADTQKLPAEKQIEAVSKKLMELNPGFDGKVTRKVEKGMVTELDIFADHVTDISPMRAVIRLKTLKCFGSGLGKGILSDMSPLEGMSLARLSCNRTLVSNLSPLAGMKLTYLNCENTDVADLSPLARMPLMYLSCDTSAVSDLWPLHTCTSLTTVNVEATSVTTAQVAALQKALPNCKIEWDDPAKAKTPAPAPAGKK